MYTYIHINTHTYIQKHHSMWTPQTSTLYALEAEPGVPNE